MSVPAYITALVTSSLVSRTASWMSSALIAAAPVPAVAGGVVARSVSSARTNLRAPAAASWFAGSPFRDTDSVVYGEDSATTVPPEYAGKN